MGIAAEALIHCQLAYKKIYFLSSWAFQETFQGFFRGFLLIEHLIGFFDDGGFDI